MPSKLLIAGLSVAAAMPVSAWIARGQFIEPLDNPVEVSGAAAPADAMARPPAADSIPSIQPRPVANSPSPSTTVSAPAETAPAPESPMDSADQKQADRADGGGETLYLTIVGDQTYMSRGLVADGPPSLTDLRSGSFSTSSARAGSSASLSGNSARASVIATQAQRRPTSSRPASASSRSRNPSTTSPSPEASRQAPGQSPGNGDQSGLTGNDRPWVDDRPWPNAGCPWTLPEGTSQQQANTLSAQYGCRYLASCSFATQQCTFYYQGSS